MNKNCHSFNSILLGQSRLERNRITCRSGFLGRQVTKEVLSRATRNAGIARFMTNEEFNLYCIELQNGMYGQVDAALRFFVRFVGHLMSNKCNGIIQSKADHCVFYKKDVNGFPLMVTAVTVDDCLMGGHPKELKGNLTSSRRWILGSISVLIMISNEIITKMICTCYVPRKLRSMTSLRVMKNLSTEM